MTLIQKLLSKRHLRGGLGGLAMPGFLGEDTLGSLKREAGILTEVREMVCAGSGVEPKENWSTFRLSDCPD